MPDTAITNMGGYQRASDRVRSIGYHQRRRGMARWWVFGILEG
jgi:hypothetical protein